MKAMRTPIVSWFAKKMRCIAVERPQDLAKPGVGKIKIKSDTEIIGIGTEFKKEIMAGDMINIPGTDVRYLIHYKTLYFRYQNKS